MSATGQANTIMSNINRHGGTVLQGPMSRAAGAPVSCALHACGLRGTKSASLSGRPPEQSQGVTQSFQQQVGARRVSLFG